MKKYLPALLIIVSGLVITVTILVYKPKNEDNKPKPTPLAQEVEWKVPEVTVAPKELQTDKIPPEWKTHLPEIKELLFQDVIEPDNDWYDIVGLINNPANKAFVDITGDGIAELMITNPMRPVGGTCFNVLRLNNNKVEFVNQINPMDRRSVEVPIEGCIIGNGVYGASFELDSVNKAIVSLNFWQSDGYSRKSSCNVTAWTWDDSKKLVVINNNLSLKLTKKTCAEMDDFLNGR